MKFEKLDDLENIIQQWESLQIYRSSIFLSTTWIKPWLTIVKNLTSVYVISFISDSGRMVGMAFLTEMHLHRRKLFSIKQLSLNESEKKNTKFIIEYNDILYDPGYYQVVYDSFIDFLANSKISFDEIRLNTIYSQHTPNIKSLCNKFNLTYILEKTSKSWYIDLSRFKNDPDGYLLSLSKNKREQIRRSIKYFLQFGKEEVKFAASKEEALYFFDQLGILHQKYWVSKGQSGSFSNEKWVEFHKTLIRDFFDNIHLVRISYGKHIVGYLYNFRDDGTAYSIQSGFNYSNDKNNRPGIVSHYLITRHYINNSIKKYDFLAGEMSYKQSLSTDFNLLKWHSIQRKSWKMRAENAILSVVRFIRKNIIKSTQIQQ